MVLKELILNSFYIVGDVVVLKELIVNNCLHCEGVLVLKETGF